jgi:hypothetical protein
VVHAATLLQAVRDVRVSTAVRSVLESYARTSAVLIRACVSSVIDGVHNLFWFILRPLLLVCCSYQ